MPIDFTKKMLSWNRNLNKRVMPWKGETDPYRIWLSEIILQQTRVEQGWSYYEKFIKGFPTIQDLAKAEEKVVFKYWEGLGYYSRCRNLIAAAKKINSLYKGHFPSTYSDILALPGVGPYTAAAIASFAFGLPHAVVDGNVERVLSRYFGISTPPGTSAGKKLFTEIAGSLLPKKEPAAFNQAIMDFGATVCRPRNPLCSGCLLSKNCQAFQYDWIQELPRKIPAAPKKTRWLYYFVVTDGKNKLWVRERKQKDIWQHLYEFVLWETGKIIPQHKFRFSPFFQELFEPSGMKIESISPVFSQTLTHQRIIARFVHLSKPLAKLSGYQSVSRKNLSAYPFPKLLTDYIRYAALF